MMKNSFWEVGAFLVISIMAIAMCIVLYISASQINATFRSYTEGDLETIEYLSHIQAYFSENERLIYEYYTNPESRTDILIKVALVRDRIKQSLNHIRPDFIESDEYHTLLQTFESFDKQLQALDAILDDENQEASRAHGQLGLLSRVGESVPPALDSLLGLSRNRAEVKQSSVSEELNNIVNSILIFTFIALLLLLMTGFSVQSRLKTDAARKKLAYFPERSPIAVYSVSSGGEVSFANPASHRMAAQISPDTETLLPADIQSIIVKLKESRTASLQHEYKLHDHILSATLKYLPEYDQCHIYVSDITEKYTAEEELRKLAYYDQATGLPNSSMFVRDCREWISRDDNKFSVILFSFLRFDLITRSVDEPVIDKLLARATKSVLNNMETIKPGSSVRLYRLSGVNFIMLVGGNSDAGLSDVTDAYAGYIQDVFSRPVRLDRREFYLNPVISSCICPDDAITTDSLIGNARAGIDDLVKKNKHGYQRFDQRIREKEQEWLATETSLRRGIDNHELQLYYQPKISARDQGLSGLEALVRWVHDGKIVSPDKFIPVAEESGLIIPLGEWVLREACRQASEWCHGGITGFSVAVNVSAIQFYQANFVDDVQAALEANHLPPDYLELELTESVLMQDIDKNIETLDTLHDMGIRLSLDDFGTGYSSLAYLKRLPISSLKIDRTFIASIDDKGTEHSMVKMMIDMAHLLGIKAIAEGVENESQVSLLNQLDCDEFQGFLYSRPVIASEIQQWWRQSTLEAVKAS